MATKKPGSRKGPTRKKKIARKPAGRPATRRATKKGVTRPRGHAAKLASLRRKLGGAKLDAMKAMTVAMRANDASPAAVNAALDREAMGTGVDASQIYTIAICS